MSSKNLKAATVNAPPPDAVFESAIATYGITKLGFSRSKKVNTYSEDTKPAIAKAWQVEAFDMLDEVGELFFGINWLANALAKVKFVISERVDSEYKTVDSTDARELEDELLGHGNAKEEVIRAIGFNWSLVGEAWILRKTETPGCEVLSVMEVSGDEVSGYRVIRDRRKMMEPLREEEDIIRIWRRSASLRFEAASSIKPALPPLREIIAMNRHITRQTNSRLSNSGMLLVPNEISIKLDQDETVADYLTRILGQAAEIAAQHSEDIATTVPQVISAPSNVIDKFNLIKFWTDLDDKALEIRRDAIRRFALALEMPPEVLLGTAGMNRWSTWALDENTVKASIEPMANSIANMLTEKLLHLSEEAKAKGWIFRADTSQLRLRPSRGREAIELYNLGILKSATVRTENGFSEVNDAPSAEDIKEWALRQVTKGSYAPLQSQAALKELGVDLDVDLSGLPAAAGRPDPSLKDHEDRRTDGLSADVIAMSVLASRAVERAGARLKQRTRQTTVQASTAHLSIPVLPSSLDDLLKDAWATAGGFVSEDSLEMLTARADSYVRTILTAGTEYSFEDCQKFLGR